MLLPVAALRGQVNVKSGDVAAAVILWIKSQTWPASSKRAREFQRAGSLDPN